MTLTAAADSPVKLSDLPPAKLIMAPHRIPGLGADVDEPMRWCPWSRAHVNRLILACPCGSPHGRPYAPDVSRVITAEDVVDALYQDIIMPTQLAGALGLSADVDDPIDLVTVSGAVGTRTALTVQVNTTGQTFIIKVHE